MSDTTVMIVAMIVFAAWILTLAQWAQVQAVKAMYKQQDEHDEKGQAE